HPRPQLDQVQALLLALRHFWPKALRAKQSIDSSDPATKVSSKRKAIVKELACMLFRMACCLPKSLDSSNEPPRRSKCSHKAGQRVARNHRCSIPFFPAD